MATRRFHPADRLDGATRFSDDRATWNTLELIRQLKAHPQFLNVLTSATTVDRNWGRRRAAGNWALLYVAFVSSREEDIEPWWSETSPELWQLCGFSGRRAYQTTYERFVELEEVAEGFAEAAAAVIAHCRRHDSRVGAHVHADGTEAQTHAALIHDCPAGSPCWARIKTATKGRVRGPRMAKRPNRAPNEAARSERQKLADSHPEDRENETPLVIGDGDALELEEKGIRIKVGSCWYRCRDADAGVRLYTRPDGSAKNFWTGYYNHKVLDHFTGAPLAIVVSSASIPEWHIYPELVMATGRALGGDLPETMTCDAGFSFKSVFEANTTLGIASVIPYRRNTARKDGDEWDRHGVPRCKHCGGPTRFSAFRHDDPRGPRMWFFCDAPRTPKCPKKQSMLCSREWKTLVPLWRTDPLYHELRATQNSYAEGPHDYLRDRYRVAGKSLSERPKRIGRGVQQLRSNAAILIEWFRIAFREGWLGSARSNAHSVKACGGPGLKAHHFFLRYRERQGLNGHYGREARALGIGLRTPPSERERPQPPPDPPPDPPPADTPPF